LHHRHDRNGPYDIVIDGANVAFYGQNFEGGGFNMKQVVAVTEVREGRRSGQACASVAGPPAVIVALELPFHWPM